MSQVRAEALRHEIKYRMQQIRECEEAIAEAREDYRQARERHKIRIDTIRKNLDRHRVVTDAMERALAAIEADAS